MPVKVAEKSPRPIPVTPSEERWREMTPAQREQFIVEVNTALSDPLNFMSEGRPHKKAKSRALDMLGLHFRTMGRNVYLAEEFAVLYPNAPPFTPDVMAVLDVEEPENDERSAWVVAEEGKGPDWVLEVLWAGDRKKDLEENVIRYAAFGIPEYFVYDQKQQRILGYRLPVGAKRYQPILAQAGLYRSNVLGIDLAIVGRTLKFFQGSAELYDTRHLIERLEGIVQNLQERAESAQQKHDFALATMRNNIVTLLADRGIMCSANALARLEDCSDFAKLNAWLMRTLRASTEADVFSD